LVFSAFLFLKVLLLKKFWFHFLRKANCLCAFADLALGYERIHFDKGGASGLLERQAEIYT